MTTGNALGEKLSGLNLATAGTGTTGTAGTVGNLGTAGTAAAPSQTAAQYLASTAQQTGATNAVSFNSCVSTQKYKTFIDADYQSGEQLFTESGLKAQGQGGTPTLVIGKPGQKGYIVVGAVPYATIKALLDKVADGTAQDADADAVVPNMDTYVGSFTLMGQETAPVTVVEYSDFQCPFCKRLYDASLVQLKQEYVQTGKIKFQYRHYPLSFHPNAMPAALAYECAKEQGKALEMHDKLFQTQDNWSNLS